MLYGCRKEADAGFVARWLMVDDESFRLGKCLGSRVVVRFAVLSRALS